jgi:hypothetical protein
MASPLARLQPEAVDRMEDALSVPAADISPGAAQARESALQNPPVGVRASPPASRSSNSGSGTWPTVNSSVDLALLEVGQVALVAINLIGENRYNARVFYLASDIDATAVSMQKNAQLAIATGWVDGERLLLKDGQKRARSARAGALPYLKVEICIKPDPREST